MRELGQVIGKRPPQGPNDWGPVPEHATSLNKIVKAFSSTQWLDHISGEAVHDNPEPSVVSFCYGAFQPLLILYTPARTLLVLPTSSVPFLDSLPAATHSLLYVVTRLGILAAAKSS